MINSNFSAFAKMGAHFLTFGTVLAFSMVVSLSVAQAETLTPISPSFIAPTYVTHAGDDSNRLFVTEKAGRIRILKNGEILPVPFLDIRSLVGTGGERGLSSVAFHPKFKQNRKLYVAYANKLGDLVVAEYKRNAAKRNVVQRSSRRVLLVIPHRRSSIHYSGQLQFGPDGYLYIGVGDGGPGGDPDNNAQNMALLLGKILRIDINRGARYRIPSSNPFRNTPGARGEIFAVGFRNPWRFSFDPMTNRLFAADVGQDSYEEVSLIERGKNYGWNTLEATHCYLSEDCSSAGLTSPIIEYNHEDGSRSITGGYVYHGADVPALTGKYIYGDFVSGKIWRATEGEDLSWSSELVLDTELKISSFGVTQAGELLVVDYASGLIYRIDE